MPSHITTLGFGIFALILLVIDVSLIILKLNPESKLIENLIYHVIPPEVLEKVE